MTFQRSHFVPAAALESMATEEERRTAHFVARPRYAVASPSAATLQRTADGGVDYYAVHLTSANIVALPV